jgi:L-fuculose-phosphate aldolase
MDKEKIVKQELVKYGRKIAEAEFIIGSGGNISTRCGNVVFIKAKGINMVKANSSDYVSVDLKTGKIRPKLSQPSSEYRMHILCYLQRPDIRAVIHVHPPFCIALSSKINSLRSGDYEFLANIKKGRVRIISYIRAGTLRLAKVVSKALKQEDAVILKNHGLVCVGRSLEEAYVRCQAIERASLIYILRKIIKLAC